MNSARSVINLDLRLFSVMCLISWFADVVNLATLSSLFTLYIFFVAPVTVDADSQITRNSLLHTLCLCGDLLHWPSHNFRLYTDH